MNPAIPLAILILFLILCFVWAVISAIWAAPAALLFQIIGAIYLIKKMWGVEPSKWVLPVFIFLISSVVSGGIMYMFDPVFVPLKSMVGEIEARIILTLASLTILFLGFFLSLKHFIDT